MIDNIKQYDNLPQELRDNGKFCVWKYVQEKDDAKPKKVPFNPVTGYGAQSNNPDTFTDFKTALSKVDGYDGLGVGAFDGFSFVDIDKCFENNKPNAFAVGIIELMNSPAEISPSGTGIRIYCKATGFVYDKTLYYINNQKRGLEIYVSGATQKFLTLTGNMINNAEFGERGAELQLLLDKYMLRPTPIIAASETESVSYLTDEEVIQKAMSARNGETFKRLWNGDISGFASPSEADMAMANILAFWCNRDVEQMDRLFRQTVLMRDKWDRPQSGSTYGALTLAKAAAEVVNTYKPRGTAENDFTDNKDLGLLGTVSEWKEPVPLDTITPPVFPLECYPRTIGAYAKALSEYTQTDPAMAGVIQLGLLGTLFQNKVSVVSVNGNVEQLSIYATAIAPPAERKSEVIRHSTGPLNKFAAQYNLEHRADISMSKARKKLLAKALTIAEKGDNEEALFKAQEDYDNFKEPQPLTLVADDIETPNKPCHN